MVQLPSPLRTARNTCGFTIRLQVTRAFSLGPHRLSSEDELILESVADDLRKQPPAQRIRGKRNHDTGRYGRYEGAHSVDLPKSPFMDPVVIAARELHKAPKPAPSKELTPFQTKLRHNVYAQALATPIRTCGVTQARLPLFFLLGFQIQAHPETGAPWYLPEGLSDEHPDSEIYQGRSRASQNSAADEGSENARISPVGIQHSVAQRPEAEKLLAYQPEGRMVGRRSVVRDSQVQVGKYKGWIRIIPRRLQEKNIVKIREIIWREDMETFILKLLRDRVTKRLRHLLHGGSGYLAKSTDGFDGVKDDMEVGCVLWLGPRTSPLQEESGGSFEPRMPLLPPPAQFDDSLDLMTRKHSEDQVPVHNLSKLLGRAHLELLRSSGSFFDSEVVVIKYKLDTLPARRQLWRLQGYLADNKQP
ncbi:MAG: hypothetical protein M1835_007984 [Candelina submexicana]|nr:MAG: hypothetical protein M1835_007984 [Candelina submexicana]